MFLHTVIDSLGLFITHSLLLNKGDLSSTMALAQLISTLFLDVHYSPLQVPINVFLWALLANKLIWSRKNIRLTLMGWKTHPQNKLQIPIEPFGSFAIPLKTINHGRNWREGKK